MNIKTIYKKITNILRFSRKKQWGTERQIFSLSSVHDRPSGRVIAFSRLSIVLTVSFWFMYVVSVIVRQLIDGPQSYQFTMEAFGYLIIVTLLTFSAFVYLITRQGALQRFSKHVRASRKVLDRYFFEKKSPITILIPSYDEETQVIRKTMLSAALQEYPDIRIVLLIDDDPLKIRLENVDRFNNTRALSGEIETLLSEPYRRFSRALARFEKANSRKRKLSEQDILEIAAHYLWASDWLNKLSEKEKIEDHTDIFFADQILCGLAKKLDSAREELLVSYGRGENISVWRVAQLYRRLVWIFGAKLEFFERKRYASLSHEPNKAMNLNSYIGLMGGMYQKEETDDGIILMPTTVRRKADLIVNDSEFVLTLDADSVLLQEYCLRLVYFLQQPGNADVAVTQTPYSSFRGAFTRIERLAGATTDIQHIVHQGMSYYNATFWVGANAVIRKRALDDLEEKEWMGGFEIKRYIQDYTAIEDTESSIDLALKDWRLVSYPERLSYSATPPDFGSLIIQRRRWANGGLLIIPKLWRLLQERKNKNRPLSKLEFIIRLNYIASIAWSNLGLVFLLAYPYDGRLLSPLVLLAAIPYFLSMAVDLKYCHYKFSDIIRIYGFNLILLPVNIAGTLKSFQQALTAKKAPFARTPKVKNRTAAGLPYLLSPLFIVGFSLFTLWRNIYDGNWGNAAFAGFNAFAATWAIFSYIGIKNMIVDIWLGLIDILYVEVYPNKSSESVKTKAGFNWKNLLHYKNKQNEFYNSRVN